MEELFVLVKITGYRVIIFGGKEDNLVTDLFGFK